MRNKLISGESICDYFKEEMNYPAESEMESTIKIDTGKTVLKCGNNPAGDDIENAIAIYEAYRDINETQASDSRLWTYLSHVTFRDYTIRRWAVGGNYENLKSNNAKKKAINFILSHWFSFNSNNDRMLRRNSIARLWWACHLTKSPWANDPEYFKDLESDDPYRFTRILLQTQDIYQNVLERGLGRDNRILITILEFIEANKDVASRYPIRDLIKELNLSLSVKNLSLLERKKLREAIFKMGSNILEKNNSK